MEEEWRLIPSLLRWILGLSECTLEEASPPLTPVQKEGWSSRGSERERRQKRGERATGILMWSGRQAFCGTADILRVSVVNNKMAQINWFEVTVTTLRIIKRISKADLLVIWRHVRIKEHFLGLQTFLWCELDEKEVFLHKLQLVHGSGPCQLASELSGSRVSTLGKHSLEDALERGQTQSWAQATQLHK